MAWRSRTIRQIFREAGITEGIKLNAGQRAWYAKKAENQLSDMKREFPSTAEEAFEASIEGHITLTIGGRRAAGPHWKVSCCAWHPG